MSTVFAAADDIMRVFAIRHNKKGINLEEQGHTGAAIAAYEKAIAADGTWAVPWYNLGLLHKRRRNWPESLRCNREAVRLDPSDGDAWWNLGIAATALDNWAEARRAWRECGIDIPEGEGAIEMDLGVVPVRINPESEGEVIWAKRIDPARAVILSIPLPESGHRYGDLLLHDGAVHGYRMFKGTEVPVFDELQTLEGSRFGTFEARVMVTAPEDITELERLCDRASCGAEDWSTVRRLCQQCSEGRPHEHTAPAVGPDNRERRIGIAAASEAQAWALLRTWLSTRTGCQVLEVKTILSPPQSS